jgi:hypothetical protein
MEDWNMQRVEDKTQILRRRGENSYCCGDIGRLIICREKLLNYRDKLAMDHTSQVARKGSQIVDRSR